jgi:acyl-coenzyme A thioesterase PaaI-like protein
MNDGNRLLFERIFQNAEFVRSLGIQLTSFGKGWCETRMNVLSVHRQQHGLTHAGS